jgi:molybdopterin-guanine dinucleotide biosynthesis protein A
VADGFSGVVLTGGRSTRMGQDKSLLVVDGEAMATRVMRALREAGASEVACVGGDVDALHALGMIAIPDETPDAGPLGGLLAGMAWAAEPATIVAPCDLTDPSAAQFQQLLGAFVDSDALAAVPIVDGRWRPLPVVVRAAAHDELSQAFAAGERAVHRAIERIDFLAVDVGAVPDADTPEDLSRRR